MTTLVNAPANPGERTDRGGNPQRSRGLSRTGLAGRWLLRHDGFLALLVYVTLALIWNRGVLAHPGSNCACGTVVDPADNADLVWWFELFVHALGHGQSLLHPTSIWSPNGIAMAGTTASLLLGFVAAPFTLLWGPIVSYNIVMVSAPVVSGWGANRLCREITGSAWPSLVAGATYGFSSYEVGQLVGHPHVAVTLVPPLAALVVIRLLKGSISRRRFLVQMTLLLITQIFISVEVMFTMTIVGVVALAAAWFTGGLPRTRETVDKFGLILVALVLCAVATLWYTVQVLGAPAYAVGEGSLYPTDLLSFFIPLPYAWLGGSRLYSVSRLFPAGWNETGAYLGLPLLLIIADYMRTRWRDAGTRALAIMLAFVTLWVLGPRLFVAGKRTIPLPYALFDKLPILSEALEGRIAVYLTLIAAVVLALWLTRVHGRSVGAWSLGILALVAVLPNLATPSFHNVGAWTNPRFFSTTTYRHYIKPGDTVLPILWGQNGESMMWQAEDKMYWNMADGDWLLEPPAGWKSRINSDLWANTPRTGDGQLLKALIVKRNVSEVLIQDQTTANVSARPWRRIAAAAGLKVTADVGGMTVYRVPSAWLTHE